MSILPSLAIELQEKLNNINKTSAEELKPIGRSFLFDFEKAQFVVESGKIIETNERVALQQWISLCIKTTIDKYEIYKGTGFGINNADIIGRKRLNEFYSAELLRELREGLLKNKQIESIDNIIFTREQTNLIANVEIKLKNKDLLKQSVVI